MRWLVVTLVTLLSVFMVATVVIAVWQESIGWGWWWAIPLGAVFVLAVIGFRLVIQRADERARLRDAELDRLETEGGQ
ncbi:hypothetical protein [Tessaracoccus oleiagri]|uniref:Uncharacterized protein n=1 Tax=Tessaracoccus oleiagri TaxID=686624 RepID=A0A1G9N7E6_9ACTN|nr:hypothetical protein [Tessaracoccus oleiagri]SDL82221.1 hypothetical protein SAMN04488242_2938 [Tessaracoccus oleiagri]